MKNHNLLKTSAVALCSAAVMCIPFLNSGKKYVPRANQQASLYTNFAGAAEYYHWLKMDPSTGKINLDAMAQFQLRKNSEYMSMMGNSHAKTSNMNSAVLGLNWLEMGPDNVGGRCRAILVDKNNPSILFAGGVSGGLFRSNNGGANWTPINDQLSSLIVSCITQDGDGHIYFGTGEGMARNYNPGDGNSAFPGTGMFKMRYLGNGNYTAPYILPSTVPTPNTTPTTTSSIWCYINRLKCSPTKVVNGNYIVYAATNKGLYYSTDTGATWQNAISTFNTFCADVDVALDGAVYASGGSAMNSGNKIYYLPASSNGVGTFTNITPPASQLSGANTGRIELAVCPSKSNIIYASVANPINSASAAILTAVFQSFNNGTTWNTIAVGSSVFLPFATYGQGDYDHVLEVFPDNPYSIILGGTDFYRWDQVDTTIAHQGIGSFSQISNQFASPFNPTFVHADKHAITFDPTDPNKIYFGCDGGIFRTTNRCSTYTALNNGFNATQFYSVSFERDALWNYGTNNGQFNQAGVFGGAQDNGTQYISGNGNSTKTAVSISGGDGFYSEASMLSPYVFFSTSYYGLLTRTASRSAPGSDFYPGRRMISCSVTTKPGDGAFASFITPIALWESSNMTNSPDSVSFAIDSLRIPGIIVANGSTSNFVFTIPKPYPSTTILASTLKIIAGTQTVTCSGGILMEGLTPVGSYTALNDSVNVTFATPPPGNTPIKVVAAVTYQSGSQITVTSESANLKFLYTFPVSDTTGDTIMIQDVIQSRLAVGMSGSIFLCANPLNFTAIPNWIKIAGANSFTSTGVASGFGGTIQTMAWGGSNVLYVANQGGTVYRLSGMAAIRDSAHSDIDSGACVRRKTSPVKCDKIGDFTGSVTSISVDPTNPDRVIVTLGNYGFLNHVYYCTTGTTCPISSNSSNFTVVSTVDNPVYSSTFVQTSYGQTNTNNVLIGTEDGVYSIDLSNQGAGWQAERGTPTLNFPNVPTFMLKQQTRGNWECYNSGIIYAGTHGRGFWQAQNYYSALNVGVPEIAGGNKGAAKAVKIFPNPANNFTTVNFTLNDDRRISIDVYDLKGSKVKTVNCGKLNKGPQNINLELDGISLGTYIVSVTDECSVLGTCRFVKID